MCGGFVGDILDGVGDLIEGVADVVGDVVEGVVDVVEDIGSGIDDFVNDVIPGGWAGVAGGALLAVGIYNPTLFGLAEAGALTTEAITAAGIDAAALAEGVATIAPEVLAATEVAVTSGVAPEIIAMATSTGDGIAALNAAMGWTTADIGYLTSIGAPEALIATAVTNNAAIAAAEAAAAEATTTAVTDGATTAVTDGATTTVTDGATTAATDGSTTQIFDDGSSLTTNADGTITSVGTDGATQTTQIFDDGSTITTNSDGTITSVGTDGSIKTTQIFDDGSSLTTNSDGTVTSVGTDGVVNTTGGGVPVVDAVSVPGAGAGTPDPTLGTALGNLGSAVVDSLGPLGTAALLGGGAIATGLINSPGTAAGTNYAGSTPYEWGQATPLVSPGLNPGYIGMAASQPFYKTTNPTDAQFYWGAHNPVNTPADLDKYNNLPNAPATPWGAGPTAVGGQAQVNVPNFVNQYVNNPAWANVNAGAGAGYMPPAQSAVAPVAPAAPTMQPAVMPQMSQAEIALAARTSGAPTAQLTTGPAVPVMVP